MKGESQRERALVQAAAQLAGAERASFLNGVCRSDPALRQRLEALLAAHEEPDGELATQAEAARPSFTLDLVDAPNEVVGQALLNRNRPLPDQADRRGWEWRYLWNRSRSDEIATLGSHGHYVTTLAFSPIGHLLASGGWDGQVRLWNWKDRLPAGELDVGDRVQAVVFRPMANGSTWATPTAGFAC